MNKLIVCVSVLCLIFSSMSSLIFGAMSSDQLALYDAAIKRQNVEETLMLLEKGTIDLNKKFLNLEGKETTFLHELSRVAIKELRPDWKIQNKGEVPSSETVLNQGMMLYQGVQEYQGSKGRAPSIRRSSISKKIAKVILISSIPVIRYKVVPTVVKCVKQRTSVKENVKFSHNILMLIKLFVGYGADLDLDDDSGMSARDLLVMSNVRKNKEVSEMIKMLINPLDDTSSLITEVKGEISRPSEIKRCRTCCKRCRKSMHTKCE